MYDGYYMHTGACKHTYIHTIHTYIPASKHIFCVFVFVHVCHGFEYHVLVCACVWVTVGHVCVRVRVRACACV